MDINVTSHSSYKHLKCLFHLRHSSWNLIIMLGAIDTTLGQDTSKCSKGREGRDEDNQE